MVNECSPVFKKCRLVPHGYLSIQFLIFTCGFETRSTRTSISESRAPTEKRPRVPGTLESPRCAGDCHGEALRLDPVYLEDRSMISPGNSHRRRVAVQRNRFEIEKAWCVTGAQPRGAADSRKVTSQASRMVNPVDVHALKIATTPRLSSPDQTFFAEHSLGESASRAW